MNLKKLAGKGGERGYGRCGHSAAQQEACWAIAKSPNMRNMARAKKGVGISRRCEAQRCEAWHACGACVSLRVSLCDIDRNLHSK